MSDPTFDGTHINPDHLADRNSADARSLAAMISSGRDRFMVVGFGIAALVIVYQLRLLAREKGRTIEVLIVHDGFPSPSDGAGGWFMPFVCPDPSVGGWAIRSWDQWAAMLDDLDLGQYRRPMNSLIVSNENTVALPAGHPGRASFIDPADYGLPYYQNGIHLDDGAILSVCSLMPALRSRIAALPGVTVVRRHLHGMFDVVGLAREFGAAAVCVAAGDRARFLTGDETIVGDMGVLLNGSLVALPPMYQNLAIMDEDVESALSYHLPHWACGQRGHSLLGGISGDLLDEEWMWKELWAANQDFARAPRFARAAAYAVYDRIHARMPVLAAALPRRLEEPGACWFGVRPAAARVVTEWLPDRVTGGMPVYHLGGLGGSGFTITPAVVYDALRTARPDDQMSRSYE